MATIRLTGRRQGDPLAELDQAILGLGNLPRVIADTSATAARTAILDSVLGARGTLSFSGLDATLDVDTTVTVGDTSAQVGVRPTPAGAWAIVDKGARAHPQRRDRGMPTPYGVFSRVGHPGVAGLAVAGPARAAADRATDEAAAAAVAELPRD